MSQDRATIANWEQDKKRYLAQISGVIVKRMELVGEYTAEQARTRAPKWRGILRSDITYNVSVKGLEIECRVGAKKRAYWGYFAELGTKRQAAHPWLRPSVWGNAQEILRILREGR